MRVLDLFSGIGGFSLGLERAGMRTVQFVEIDPYCQAVLRKRWPRVPCHGDIRTFHAAPGFADVICGGFPCQDISIAGSGAGLLGERSGLWAEYARIIGEVRPRFAIVENVSALLHRGLGEVLGELAALGYDCEWHCIPASSLGAPHRRDRIWIVAHSQGERRGKERSHTLNGGMEACAEGPGEAMRGSAVLPHPISTELRDESWWWSWTHWACPPESANDGAEESVADAGGEGLEGRLQPQASWTTLRTAGGAGWWEIEPSVGRVANGVPAWAHRLRCLGNAVVPQIPEIIGRAIMRHAHTSSDAQSVK